MPELPLFCFYMFKPWNLTIFKNKHLSHMYFQSYFQILGKIDHNTEPRWILFSLEIFKFYQTHISHACTFKVTYKICHPKIIITISLSNFYQWQFSSLSVRKFWFVVYVMLIDILILYSVLVKFKVKTTIYVI